MHTRQRSERIRGLVREIAHAARVLRRTPAFSLVACLTLALGIGATTAIYMVLDAVVLRPLPYRQSGELVSVLHPATVPGSGEVKWGMSAAGYFHLRENNTTLSDLGGYYTSAITVTGEGGAEVARAGLRPRRSSIRPARGSGMFARTLFTVWCMPSAPPGSIQSPWWVPSGGSSLNSTRMFRWWTLN